jgi:excinuclease UvrABC nuclease subunit
MINKRAGVYKLVNTENNKIYIKSSKDLKERKKVQTLL